MPKNVGLLDRSLRVLLGLGLLSLFVILDGDAQWLGVLGFVPLATAFMAYCPFYSLLGVNTCPANSQKET